MRNIFGIILDDFRRLTSSVVSIIIMIGLCVVPCLYAWFNIFSNWDPYGLESTGRIAVAVANEDVGADMLGLNINVGEKVIESLKGNDAIAWKFVSHQKAMKGLKAGDYYAAVVIPEDFTEDVLSFSTGDLTHPHLDYYENVKKNAIAPKITDKAQQTLKQQVDAAFVGSVARTVTEASAIAKQAGMEPQDMFADLSDRVALLSERMEDLTAVVGAAQGLSDAANTLLSASNSLAGSTQDALRTGKKVLDKEKAEVPALTKDAKAVSASIKKEATAVADTLDPIYDALLKASTDMATYNDYVLNDLEKHKILLKDISDSARDVADKLAQLQLTGMADRFRALARKADEIYSKLDTLEKADESTWPQIQKTLEGILADIGYASDAAKSIDKDAGQKIDDKINKAVGNARKAIKDLRKSLSDSYGDLDKLSDALSGTEDALGSLDSGLGISLNELIDMQTGLSSLSRFFDKMASDDKLKDINHLIQNSSDVIADHLASPVKMERKTVYAEKTNGSMMAPFYTVLAQFVGALFSVVLLSTRIRRKEGAQDIRLIEQFFGRFRLFLIVGLIQALVVSLGDLLYVEIQCEHPVLFVIAACVNGIVFAMINYAVVFSMDKVGMALCVIILLMQVAGGGGTFPPEVLPEVFQVLYPFIPFHYAMDAMRECVMGMYGSTYVQCIAVLLLMGLIAMAFGLLLARPASHLNKVINKSMEKSAIMKG